MNVIETERLILRTMKSEDHSALAKVLCDEAAMIHYPKAFSEKQVHEWIARNQLRYEQDGHGLWTVVLKATNEIMGDCGLTYQRVDGVDELEIGYHIIPRYWKQGFATEAAAACRDYAFNTLNANRVISWTNPSNLASRKVSEKNGMTFEKETKDSYGRPSVVYSISKDCFEK